jgi:hypothetical protein
VLATTAIVWSTSTLNAPLESDAISEMGTEFPTGSWSVVLQLDVVVVPAGVTQRYETTPPDAQASTSTGTVFWLGSETVSFAQANEAKGRTSTVAFFVADREPSPLRTVSETG